VYLRRFVIGTILTPLYQTHIHIEDNKVVRVEEASHMRPWYERGSYLRSL